MRREPRETLLDTTFLLPFFSMDIDVEGFDLALFEEYVASHDCVHLSEVSVIEAKTKATRLSSYDPTVLEAMRAFGTNLSILRRDSRFSFHVYDEPADQAFNMLNEAGFKIDRFDALLLSQASAVGAMLTEDHALLKLGKNPVFRKIPCFRNLMIQRWKDVAEGVG